MAYGAWTPWARLMALVAEANRDPKKRSRPFGESDFHPFADDTAAPRRGFRMTGAMARRIGDLLHERRQKRGT